MASRHSEEKKLKIQVLISVLTLLLTPLLSGFVVYFELQRQHGIWEVQRRIIREERLLQERIDRTDKTGRIVTSLLQKARMARTVMNNLAKVHAFPDLYNDAFIDKILSASLEIAEEYEELEAELLNTLMINGLYFSTSVKKKGTELTSSLYLLKPPLWAEEKVKLLKEEFSKSKGKHLDSDKAISNILESLDRPDDEHSFARIAKELIMEMHKELVSEE